MIMGNGIFTAIVDWRGIGDISLVVLKPVGDGAIILCHLTGTDCNISSVVYNIMPVVLQDLFRLHILGIDHQTTGIPVETMHHMGSTLLARLLEIVVEHSLHIQRRVSGSHRKDTLCLLDNDEPTVLINNLHITAPESLLVAFGLADGNLHASLQREVKLRHRLAVDLDAPTLQRGLDL